MNFAHSCLAINCYFYKLSKRIYFLFYFHYFHPLSTTRLLPCIYHHSDTLLKPSRHWHHGYYKEVCICVCLPFSRWAQTLCDAAFFLTKKKKKKPRRQNFQVLLALCCGRWLRHSRTYETWLATRALKCQVEGPFCLLKQNA